MKTSKKHKTSRFKTKHIELVNHTHYDTIDLCKLFELIYIHYKRITFDFKFNTVRVTCQYRRLKDGFCGGYAYHHNNIVVLKLPKKYEGYDGDTFEQQIVRTFEHELDHCRGKNHGNMMNDKHRNISYLPTDLKIREKQAPKKKVKTSSDKLSSLVARKKKWESKIKLARTWVSKINKQIKYYEKKHELIAATSKN